MNGTKSLTFSTSQTLMLHVTEFRINVADEDKLSLINRGRQRGISQISEREEEDDWTGGAGSIRGNHSIVPFDPILIGS